VSGKPALRRAAARVRCGAHAAGQGAACDRLLEALAEHRGRPVAGYWPMGTEIDPRPALERLAAEGPVGLPVAAKGRPLAFRLWRPGEPLVPGGFGTSVPEAVAPMVPEVLIVPLLAFDGRGHRLGYGGGHYDRTLAALRARGPVLAVGFAYAAQRVEALPVEPTDAPLDLVVTEAGVLRP
jgi:5-formyltetrahydrofolate cyclo-ligase